MKGFGFYSFISESSSHFNFGVTAIFHCFFGMLVVVLVCFFRKGRQRDRGLKVVGHCQPADHNN